jgi:GT2 family glycosyltransferase
MTLASRADSVAVVLCAYTLDRWDDICSGVESLSQQTLPPAEVVLVVDHNESLAQRAMVELCPLLPSLRVVRNTGNRGLSGARNTGIAATKSAYVAFLDDDATPSPSWLAELVDPFVDSAVFVTGGRAVPAWPESRPRWWPEEFDWVVGSSYRGMPTRISDVRNVIGCSMAFRREAFVLAGTFAEDVGRVGRTPLGCEETELCIRLRQASPGVRVVYTPTSLVHHRVTTERRRFQYFAARCRAEGISKAHISTMVGGHDATSSERDYALRTLPAAVLRGLAGPLRGDPAGPARAAVVIAGLVLTVYGFLLGTARRRFG